jgi:hypothetical protein
MNDFVIIKIADWLPALDIAIAAQGRNDNLRSEASL